MKVVSPATADSDAKDIVLFIVRRDTQCAECGEALGKGRWIRVENDHALCLTCADLAHLERVLERWARPGA